MVALVIWVAKALVYVAATWTAFVVAVSAGLVYLALRGEIPDEDGFGK